MVPSLFLAHGSPMLAIEDSGYTDFLEELGGKIKPEAIVIFTAHWETEHPAMTFTDGIYETIYDFRGFPPELYAVKYPARGSKRIALKVEELYKDRGIEIRRDAVRGLDHGSWTMLHRMYPKADIPVVQMSVNPALSPKQQFEIGKVLSGLGDENVLVIGSGVSVHNLRRLSWGQTEAEPWAVQFDDWLIDKVNNRDLDALDDYLQLAPHARLAVPTPEHFVPLFIAMGSGIDRAAKEIYRGYDLGTLSYLCFQF